MRPALARHDNLMRSAITAHAFAQIDELLDFVKTISEIYARPDAS